MVINRDKHNLFTARPGLSVYTTGATTSPMKTSSTSGSTIVVSGGGGSGLTDELASKLNSIEEGAQVNQNAYSKVTVGDNTIEAANTTDTIRITTDGKIVATLENGILKLEYKGNDDLWYKDEDGNLWTDANVYSTKEISAYGFKSGQAGGGARYLYELNDVTPNAKNPSNGNILRYDALTKRWELFDPSNLEVDLTPIYNRISGLEGDVETTNQNVTSNTNRISALEKNDVIANNLFDFVDGKIQANFDFYGVGEVSAYGYNDGEAGSGSSYLHELNDVLLTSLTSGQLLQWDGNNWVNVNSDEIGFDETRLNQILIDYATKTWVENKGYLTQHQDLSTYATQKWVEDKKYITSSALNSYATEKWVTDKGYAVATDVASTYATIEALNKKLDKDKFAESFATEMAKWFVKDDTNKGIKPVNSYGLYSDTYVSAKGVSTGTGGGGGGTSYDRLDSWAEYTSAKAGYVLSALLGYDLHTRVNNLTNSLGGYLPLSGGTLNSTTNQVPLTLSNAASTVRISFVINGNQLGYLGFRELNKPLFIDAAGNRYTLIHSGNYASYKPSYAFSEITNKPTTLEGYGITDFAVKSTIDSIDNYVTKSGIYRWANVAASSLPDTAGYGNSITIYGGGDTYLQIYGSYSYGNGCGLFWRGAVSSNTTKAWNRILDSSNYSEYTYSQTTIDSKLGEYLPLSGGTINGDLILDSTTNSRWLRFQTGNGAGWIGYHSDVDSWHLTNKNWSSEHVIIHSGNIGSQSVNYASSAGNADLFDGRDSIGYGYCLLNELNGEDINTIRTGFRAGKVYAMSNAISDSGYRGLLEYGTSGYVAQFSSDSLNKLYYRWSENSVWKSWRTVAFEDSNVASATKLQTARTIWGQSFDGTGNVSGDIHLNNSKIYWHNDNNSFYIDNYYDNVNSPFMRYMSYYGHIFTTGNGEAIRIMSNKNVLIGTTTDTGHKLNVLGATYLQGTATSGIENVLYLSTNTTTTSAKGNGVGIILGYKNLTYYSKIAAVFENSNPNYLNPALVFYTMNDSYMPGSEVERMRITSAGNVGIGTSSPTEKLHVDGNILGKAYLTNGNYGIWRGVNYTSALSTNDLAIVGDTCRFFGNIDIFTNKLYWHGASGSYYIACPTTSTGAYLEYAGYEGHRFRAANGEAMRITSTGNVLIGTTADNGARLQVGGSVVASGSVTAKSSSDYRLKCEFDYNVDYQERLLSLGKVCDFNYTPHAQEREFAFADDKRHTSVIWQDARKANITGFCSVEEDGYGTINPLSSDLIFTMVGAIQQGIVKTERIEERVVRLEKENRELKEKINLLEGGRYGC